MSTLDQEQRALKQTWEWLLALSSGQYKVSGVRALRQHARDLAKHFPLGAETLWLDLHTDAHWLREARRRIDRMQPDRARWQELADAHDVGYADGYEAAALEAARIINKGADDE